VHFTEATWCGPEQPDGEWLQIEVRGNFSPYRPATRWSPAEGGDLEDLEVREVDGQRPHQAWCQLEEWARRRGLSAADVQGLLDRIEDQIEEDSRGGL
jgi:hypothetical protein